ncbi:hypothetical protein [Bythopirellula polymerisocia]|nr:hypothetical protein [Bythopirellula polymerisocia]
MKDGSFQLSENSVSASQQQLGVFPGTYQVAVSATKILSEGSNEVEWLAPSKYADSTTSGIELNIAGPKENLQIDLTWEGDELSEDVSASDAEKIHQAQDASEEATSDSTTDKPQDEEAPEKS